MLEHGNVAPLLLTSALNHFIPRKTISGIHRVEAGEKKKVFHLKGFELDRPAHSSSLYRLNYRGMFRRTNKFLFNWRHTDCPQKRSEIALIPSLI
jgi:hypothetical protein